MDYYKFRTDDAGVAVLTFIVGVSRNKALQVDKVATLIGSFDSFAVNGACQFNIRSFVVLKFARLQVKCVRHFYHKLVELIRSLDHLLLIVDGAVLSQRSQIIIVKNAWNDALTRYSVALVLH